MTQLVIDNLTLPYVKGGGYRCREEVLSKQLEMISGRMVEEVRGLVWVIEYTAPTLDNTTMAELMKLLRHSKIFPVTFLPDNSTGLMTSTFLCTQRSTPSFIMEHLGEPVWNNVSFTLREVEPHD